MSDREKSPMIRKEPHKYYWDFVVIFTNYLPETNEFEAQLEDGTEILIDPYVGNATELEPSELLGRRWKITDGWLGDDHCWLTNTQIKETS